MIDTLLTQRIILFAVAVLCLNTASAQNSLYPQTPAWKELPAETFTNVTKTNEGSVLQLPGTATYRVPDGGKGWYNRGLMQEYDGVIDARHWYGIRLDVQLQNEELFEVLFLLKIPQQTGRHNFPDSTAAGIKLQGKGWHTVTVPFNSFDYNKGQVYMLKFLKQIAISGRYANSLKAQIALRNIKLVKGAPLKLNAIIRSRPGGADSTVRYIASITNSSESAQQVSLSFLNTGWEGMKATVSPAFVTLQPGEIKPLTVSVIVPALAPQGSQEKQILLASTAAGEQQETLEFITLRQLEGPFLVHQEQGWQNVLDKIKSYDWAKQSLNDYIKAANEFEVPETRPGGIPSDQGTPGVFKSYIEQRFWPVAVAYKLTGEKKYAQKLALFLNCMADPTHGYPVTLHISTQGIPQEGGFWEGAARSYDLIKDAGVLSTAEKSLIEQSFRLYILTVEDGMGDGGISNWSVFNLCPAAQCALVIHDLQHFNYLMDGPCGIRDHIRYGTMDDGWWYEMSLSYNLGCAENLTSLGLAAKPFGIDFLNEKLPVATTQKVGLRPFEFENFQGMAFGKFGPVTQNFINIKRMWDGIMSYPDYRSVMFGMGDGHEHAVGGGDFEKAFFAFRDTAFAAVIKQGGKRDLLFGVPVLPENTPKLYSQSAHSDNAGIAVLRSQTAGREQKDQIQAAFKYGTHGGYHGHFDRASLLSIMRYGRSFWNPETSWFGYGSYMYKWWVQPSMAHNMVVVDGKQQEPVESKPLLFYSGKMMQVMGAETDARWSHPPYFGGYQQIEKVNTGNAPYVPVPPNHPQVADVTDYTEPVLQRRLLIVTDDYVVTADYLKGDKPHVFDNLLHLRGAKPDAALKPASHAGQFDTSPLSSGQFITNVTDYAVNGTGKVLSTLQSPPGMDWESGGFNGFQEPGILNVDAYNVWPQQTTLRMGNYAESYSINKKLVYEVKGDGKTLAKDSFGTWLLGRADLDISVKNIKMLQLLTSKSKGAKNSTLFWGGAKIITLKGKEIPASQLKMVANNIISTASADKDYKGGPIAIAGKPFSYALAAEPQNEAAAGSITIDLTGLDAVRFVAGVGGDAPVGNDDQVRKTVSFRTSGEEARYLTVIEPYENKSLIQSVKATTANTLMVALTDGRVQEIIISGLNATTRKVQVSITEKKNGKIIREEKGE